MQEGRKAKFERNRKAEKGRNFEKLGKVQIWKGSKRVKAKIE